MHLVLFIIALLHVVLPSTSLEQISCYPKGDLYGTIRVTFDRNDLAVYTYNSTERVNFLFGGVEIDLTGGNQRSEQVTSLKTDVEGLAILKDNGKGDSILTLCDVDLTKNSKYREDVSVEMQELIIKSASACIQPTICEKIGTITEDDYIRAKIEPRDFNENSVLFDVFANEYPNLNLLNPKDKDLINIQSTMNLLADFVIASLINQVSDGKTGQIRIPDVDETLNGVFVIPGGYFRLQNGTFRNLNRFTREKDIVIKNRALEFILKAEILLPIAEIHFNKYAVKYALVNQEGELNIEIDDIRFNLEISINYNVSPCTITITEIRPKIGEVVFDLRRNGILDAVINNTLNDLINKYIKEIMIFVGNKLERAVDGALSNLDCERYRP